MKTKQDITKSLLRDLSDDQINDIRRDLAQFPSFSGHENVLLTDKQRAVMSLDVSDKMKEVFDIMKLDYRNDPNLKDTPMRVASMWVNELMIGRYQEKPRMESFPLQFGTQDGVLIDDAPFDPGMMITKKVDIRSLCSHHLMPFFNNDDGYGLIAYKPTDKLLGISKLQRLVKWYGSRPQLQEQLTYQIYKEVCDTIGSNDVLVVMENIEHTCESLRGVESVCGRTNTIQFGGVFNDSSLRREVILGAK